MDEPHRPAVSDCATLGLSSLATILAILGSLIVATSSKFVGHLCLCNQNNRFCTIYQINGFCCCALCEVQAIG